MNREIKFRAWHRGHPKSKMLTAVLPTMLYEKKVGDSLRWLSDGQPVDVMQFTGLQDKNKKDRYEGDVIRRSTGYIFVEKIRSYQMGDKNNASCVGYDYHPDDEIIGNIFDNPELIK